MSVKVHPNPGLVFSCSVSAGNVPWKVRSMQWCNRSKWVHLRCSLLSFSRFKTLCSSHCWSCSPCFFWRSHTYQHCEFSDPSSLYTSTVLPGPSASSVNATFCPTLSFKPLISLPPTSYIVPLYPHHRLTFLAVFLYSCFLFLPDSLRDLHWIAGGLLARSTELLHFILSHLVDFI